MGPPRPLGWPRRRAAGRRRRGWGGASGCGWGRGCGGRRRCLWERRGRVRGCGLRRAAPSLARRLPLQVRRLVRIASPPAPVPVSVSLGVFFFPSLFSEYLCPPGSTLTPLRLWLAPFFKSPPSLWVAVPLFSESVSLFLSLCPSSKPQYHFSRPCLSAPPRSLSLGLCTFLICLSGPVPLSLGVGLCALQISDPRLYLCPTVPPQSLFALSLGLCPLTFVL